MRCIEDAEGDEAELGGGGEGVMKELDRDATGEANIELEDDTPSICPSEESAILLIRRWCCARRCDATVNRSRCAQYC